MDHHKSKPLLSQDIRARLSRIVTVTEASRTPT
jgi:hypothetical protein